LAKRVRRARRYVRRVYGRARRAASKMTIPIAPLAGIIGMPDLRDSIPYLMAGDFTSFSKVIGRIAGIKDGGGWDLELFKRNIIPPVAGILVHKVATKTGVNRVLAKAKVPWIRI